jgi:hypothetical protein
MKRLIFSILGVVAPLMAATQNGIIKGVVTDEAGNAESAVVVTANLRPPVPGGAAIPSSFVFSSANGLSGADGAFEIDGLPAGTFSLCAEKQGSRLLNPCIWGNPVGVTLAADATASGASVKVQNGVAIIVRVADPQGVLAANPAKDDILIGMGHNKSPFLPARVIKKDATGRTQMLVVPPGLSFNLSVRSAAFSLEDGQGNALGASAALALTAATLTPGTVQAIDPATATPNVTVKVKGPKQATP